MATMDVETLQRIELLFCQSGNVQTRRYNLKFYPNTWTGKSFVDWLVGGQVCLNARARRKASAAPSHSAAHIRRAALLSRRDSHASSARAGR